MTSSATVRVVLPQHLRTLARVAGEVTITITGPVTQRSILDTLENRFPALSGTVRDHVTHKRRPLVRFFADEKDVSNDSPDAVLPDVIASGEKPFFIVGAIAGG